MKILCTDLEGTLAPEIWQELGEHLNIPQLNLCLLYTSPSPRDAQLSRMPSSA